MKTTVRFENAVTKLYKAFHENRLNAYDCSACAVGNICDNNEEWSLIRIWYPELRTKLLLRNFNGKTKDQIVNSGYSPNEIIVIEKIFTDCFEEMPATSKEAQFKGLCAVVGYLCELDGIPNVMDFTSLFETENDQPKHELQTVF